MDDIRTNESIIRQKSKTVPYKEPPGTKYIQVSDTSDAAGSNEAKMETGFAGFEGLPAAIAAKELSLKSGGTAGPNMTTPTNNAPTETTPKKRGRPKGPLSEAEKAKRNATRAANKAAKSGTKKVAKAKKESEPVAKEKGKRSKDEKISKRPKSSRSEKIIKHGGSLVANVTVVGVSALVGARLDDMIDARPMGQDPSTILLVGEILVTAVAVYKRKRKVAHYAALSVAGTAAGKLARASKKTPKS